MKTGRLNFDTRGAEQQITRLQRGIRGLGQTVRVRIQETVERQQRQGGSNSVAVVTSGGRSPGGGAGLAAAAGAAATALEQQQNALSNLVRDGSRYEQLQNAQASAADRLRTKTEELAQAQRRLEQNQRGFADAGKSVAQSLRDNTNAVDMRTRALDRYQQELADTSAALNNYIGAERRAAAQLSAAEYGRTGGLSFDERLAQQRERTRYRGTAGRAAAAGVGAAGLSIPGLDAVVGGAGLGFAVGGPAGAAIGATTAAVTALGVAAVKTGGQVATFYAEVSKARIALAGVSSSNADYAESLRGIEAISDKLNLPIREATENYTRLRAATAAVGLGAGQTLKIFQSLASANAALGGNTERLNGILLATTQIFSKGKVSAEELRGQLGERLAGAFADFAKATGKSTADLDAALEKGEVSLKDFVAFSEFIGKKYGKNAELMAKSSESAGDRLKRAWEKLQVAIGPLLQSIGATIQNWATATVNALTPVIQKITDLLGLSRKAQNDQLYRLRQRDIPEAQRALNGLLAYPGADKAQPGSAVYESIQNARKRLAELKKEEAQLAQTLKPVATGGEKPAKPDLTLGASAAAEEALKDAERAADKLATEQRQLQQQLAQNQIALDDQVFKNQIELDRQRYELNRELQQKTRDNWTLAYTGAGREQAQLINDLRGGLEGYADRIVELKQRISEAEQRLKSAQAGVGVARMGQTSIEGAGVTGGLTGGGQSDASRGRSTGPHLHSQALGGLSESQHRSLVDRALSFDGRTASSFGLSRGHAGHGYAGLDFLTPQGTPFALNPGYTATDMGIQGALGRGMRISGPGGSFELGHLAGVKNGATGMTGGLTGQDSVAGALGDVATTQKELEGLNAQLAELQATSSRLTQTDVAGFVLKSTDAFRQQGAELTKQTEALQLRTRLEMEGVSPELIEGELAKLDISQQLAERLGALKDAYEAGTISQEAFTQGSAALTDAATGAAGAIEQLTKAQLAAADPINKLMGQLKTQLNDVRGQYAALAQTIEGEIGGAMSNAITSVINGTGTVQQAFSQMFQNIGAAFIDMATQMIAKALVMKVLGILGGGIGGGGGGFSFGSVSPGLSSGFTGTGSAVGGWSFFADGGLVTGPTPAIIGEGGEPEVVLPQSKIGAALANYRPGTGAAGLAQAMNAPEGAGGAGGVIRFESTVINGVEYVTREQAEAIGRQAADSGARRGAAGGHARVMGDFRNSRSTRSRLGLA